MALRIIYGKAGSGKSQYIYDEINKKINSAKTIQKDGSFFPPSPKGTSQYIITPEQFSFTAEQKLMENKKAVIGAEVVTFNRLAYRVMNEIGGVVHTNLTKCGKAMLIFSILQAEKNNLTFLNKSDENIEICMRLISEFKKHAITTKDLKDAQEKIDNKYLKNKLKDIVLIYEKFENKIENNYIDETDLLTILAENIDKVNILKNADVYIDEFAGFTEQEYQTIKKIIKIANSVTITFCTDNLNLDTDPNADIFYPNKVTYNKIINLLDKNENVEKIYLDKLYRFKSGELEFIEENLYSTKTKKFKSKQRDHENQEEASFQIKKENTSFEINNNQKSLENREQSNSLITNYQGPNDINLFLAKNYYSEIENVAKKINKLIKMKNLRYKDICIITKSTETYASLIKTIFNKYEIPVFIDEKRDLNQNIIVQYILSILEILNKSFSYEAVFNYLKTGFLEIDENDIFKFEKYCIKYGIKNNKFKKDFIYGKKEELEFLNELRKQIIEPLIELKEKIDEEKNAKNIAKQLYLFLINQNIENKMTSKINKMTENNLFDLAKEYEESYSIIINILDEIDLIFGEEKITIDKFIKILKIGLKNSELGKIPGTQDQVIVGDIDRSRSRKTKVVFIIGLNDGVFPSINKNQGFLDDEDRESLKTENIEIAKGTLENLYDDNFNIYKAFTTAEEQLYLSYASSDNEGKSLRASNLIFRIKKLFPNLIEESDVVEKQKNIELINERISYEDLIIKINEMENGITPEKLFFILYKYYMQNKEYKNMLNDNIKYINFKMNENIKKQNIDKLYGNKLNTSISKLEKYRSCPFSYYLQYILKLKDKEELKVQNLDTGSFMHDVINSFFEEITNNSEYSNFYEIARKALIAEADDSTKKTDEIDSANQEKQEESEKGELLNNEKANNLQIAEDISAIIEKIINKIIDEKLLNEKNYIFTATEKYKLLVQRLKRIIIKSLKYIIQSLVQSEFRLEGTEVEFGEKGKYKPIVLNLENGKTVEIIGKIDRIDVAQDENKKYVRIIDYKSSVKNIDYGNVYAGLQLQLITYLDAVCKIEDFVPAGILYFNLLEQIINSSKKLSEQEIEQRIKGNFKMKGLILADVKVAKMQDTKLEKGMSKIIPAYIDKTGNFSQKLSNIATQEEFTKLQNYINKTIKDISNEIFNGNIELKPFYKDRKTPCEYCSYKSMCGFNSGIVKKNYNFVNKLSKDEVLERIENGFIK